MSDDDEYVYDDDDDDGMMDDSGMDVEDDGDDAGEGNKGDVMSSSDARVELENKLYDAEETRNAGDSARAEQLFLEVVEFEKKLGKEVKFQWKALEQIVILRAKAGASTDRIAEPLSELLSHMGRVTPNEVSDTINAVLDAIGSVVASGASDASSLDQMYEIALDQLKSSSNEKLWFTACVKRARTFLARNDFPRLAQVVKELQGSNLATEESRALQLHFLEIKLYEGLGDTAKLRTAYENSQSLFSGVQDPRIMGELHEVGGKMLLEESRWNDAYDKLFAGFQLRQEAGDVLAKQTLKYVVLANMLAVSNINPFDSREAKVFESDPEIKAVIALRNAFGSSDVREFERVLKDPKSGLSQDAVVGRYAPNLLRTMRAEVVVRMVRPYRRMKLASLARDVGVDVPELERMVLRLILDKKILGKVDQVNGILDLSTDSREATSLKKYSALDTWSASLAKVTAQLSDRVVLEDESEASQGRGGYASVLFKRAGASRHGR